MARVRKRDDSPPGRPIAEHKMLLDSGKLAQGIGVGNRFAAVDEISLTQINISPIFGVVFCGCALTWGLNLRLFRGLESAAEPAPERRVTLAPCPPAFPRRAPWRPFWPSLCSTSRLRRRRRAWPSPGCRRLPLPTSAARSTGVRRSRRDIATTCPGTRTAAAVRCVPPRRLPRRPACCRLWRPRQGRCARPPSRRCCAPAGRSSSPAPAGHRKPGSTTRSPERGVARKATRRLGSRFPNSAHRSAGMPPARWVHRPFGRVHITYRSNPCAT